MKQIRTTIEIAAPPARVWAVLMDFPSYPRWNPLIRKIEGNPDLGQRLKVVIKPPGWPAMTIRPVVDAVDPERTFGWRGAFLAESLFVGQHSFRLSRSTRGTRFDHGEDFSGLLLGFFGKSLLPATELGFNGMNLDLKSLIENG